MVTDGASPSGQIKGANIKELAESLTAEMKKLPIFSSECCIYRVPKELYEINKKAYTPQLVSIGPFHHGKKELQAMEAHKILYLQVFLGFTEVSLEDLLIFIEENETRLRNSYVETITNKEFLKMMLLDAAFVITFLLRCSFEDFLTKNDQIFQNPWMINYVRFDMCMLENQLPFFILEELLQHSRILSHRKDWSMIKLVCEFLKVTWGSWVTDDILDKIHFSNYKVKHFVDFLRICQKPTTELHEEKQQNERATLTMPSATELQQAGVKFKSLSIDTLDCWKLFDIEFDIGTGILTIPPLQITDYTELLFRNLQAFEQCHCTQTDRCFCDYISTLNMIVNSTADVELLVRKKIIENWILENDAVRSFFKNLSKGNLIDQDCFYFSGLVKDLNDYSKERCHRWKANLKQNYFHNPWAAISVIAAAFLIILTIIQTVCSIIQVV